jgi:hypothetical protein
MSLLGRAEQVDTAIEKVASEIDRCSSADPELAAGYGTKALASAERAIGEALAQVEVLDRHLRVVA